MVIKIGTKIPPGQSGFGFEMNIYTDEILKELAKNIVDSLNAVGLFVKGEAISNIYKNKSVDTGNLWERALDYETNPEKGTVQIGATSDYAIFVEKGSGIYAEDGNGRKTPWMYFYEGHKGEKGWRITSGQKPAPFLTPAGEENVATIIKIVKFHLKKVDNNGQ